MKKEREIRVAELFAGVGGFRIGLEGWKGLAASSSFKRTLRSNYKVVWSNQWEPSTKTQHASDIYVKVFGPDGHLNQDISKVDLDDIPDHDLLVGGFPCQDYSVARTLNQSAGLEGKKGVLWWQIHRIIKGKQHKPAYLFLENVDRLLKSPVKQRGRDFAVMLASLSDLGYIVEWRVVNAAEYGMPQRRKRVFFLAYANDSTIQNKVLKLNDPYAWVLEKGVFAKAFQVQIVDKVEGNTFNIQGDLPAVSEEFNRRTGDVSPFMNSGIMIDRQVYTIETKPNYDGPHTMLRDILLKNSEVPKEYFIDKEDIEKWKYLKGAKSELRVNKESGFQYNYTEGGMVFPDPLNKPSRTIVTGEGGSTASRFKHVVSAGNGTLRRLTPIELERLNMFPDGHTTGASDVKRAFFMGNALVTGVIEKVGVVLAGMM